MYKHVFEDGYTCTLSSTIDVQKCKALEQLHGKLKFVKKIKA